jgi:hypothetical protein
LTIRPAKAIKKHDFQNTADPASRSTEINAIIETKRSIIAFMAGSGKRNGKALPCRRIGKGRRAFQVGYGVNRWPTLWSLGRPQDEQGGDSVNGHSR